MDAQDSHFSGCTVRGLPIGVPFKTKFVIPEDKRNDFKDDTDVFIILRFENLQERYILDITAEKSQYTNGDIVIFSTQTCKNALKKKIMSKHKHSSYNTKYGTDDGLGRTEALPVADQKDEIEEVSVEETFTVGCNYYNEKGTKQQTCLSSVDTQMPVLSLFSDRDNLHGETAKGKKNKLKRKGKSTPGCIDIQKPLKVKKVKLIKKESEDEECAENRRKSARIRSVGVRPDYQAIENENADYDDTDHESYEDDCVERIIVKEEKESDTEDYKENDDDNLNTRDSIEDQDVKPNIKELNKEMNIKSKASYSRTKITKNISKPPKMTSDIDPDFNPVEDDILADKSKNKNKSKKTKEDVEKDKHLNCEVLDDLEGSDSDQERKKTKTNKSKQERKVVTGEDDLDPELAGLGEKKRTLLKAKRKRQKQKQEKEAKRIRIKLHDHPDKYRVDVLESYQRKDRGKSKEECAIEILCCRLCEQFKVKNTDVMESHLECHINGDLNCDQCEYVAGYLSNLQKHKREEHKRNILICNVCGEETAGMDGLKDHLGKEHDKPQWKCKFCLTDKGKHFACVTKTAFRLHLREAHPENMVACKSCNLLYASDSQLQRHLNVGCDGGGTKLYPCDKCGKTYVSQNRVNSHINRVHNKVRQYQCPHCPFSTAKTDGLTHHLHVHTGVHPFSCDQCTFSCVQKFQLTSHMRTHTGEKPYKCSQCNYAAAWNVQLKDHVKVHSLPNTVTCEQCGIVLKDARAFKMHQGKEHAQQE